MVLSGLIINWAGSTVVHKLSYKAFSHGRDIDDPSVRVEVHAMSAAVLAATRPFATGQPGFPVGPARLAWEARRKEHQHKLVRVKLEDDGRSVPNPYGPGFTGKLEKHLVSPPLSWSRSQKTDYVDGMKQRREDLNRAYPSYEEWESWSTARQTGYYAGTYWGGVDEKLFGPRSRWEALKGADGARGKARTGFSIFGKRDDSRLDGQIRKLEEQLDLDPRDLRQRTGPRSDATAFAAVAGLAGGATTVAGSAGASALLQIKDSVRAIATQVPDVIGVLQAKILTVAAMREELDLQAHVVHTAANLDVGPVIDQLGDAMDGMDRVARLLGEQVRMLRDWADNA